MAKPAAVRCKLRMYIYLPGEHKHSAPTAPYSLALVVRRMHANKGWSVNSRWIYTVWTALAWLAPLAFTALIYGVGMRRIAQVRGPTSGMLKPPEASSLSLSEQDFSSRDV